MYGRAGSIIRIDSWPAGKPAGIFVCGVLEIDK